MEKVAPDLGGGAALELTNKPVPLLGCGAHGVVRVQIVSKSYSTSANGDGGGAGGQRAPTD